MRRGLVVTWTGPTASVSVVTSAAGAACAAGAESRGTRARESALKPRTKFLITPVFTGRTARREARNPSRHPSRREGSPQERFPCFRRPDLEGGRYADGHNGQSNACPCVTVADRGQTDCRFTSVGEGRARASDDRLTEWVILRRRGTRWLGRSPRFLGDSPSLRSECRAPRLSQVPKPRRLKLTGHCRNFGSACRK